MREFDWNTVPVYKETLAEFDESANKWFGDQLPAGERVARKNMPSTSQIVEFWFRWAEFIYKSQGVTGSEKLPAFVSYLLIDVGEPFCFGCRFRYADWEFAHAKIKSKRKGMAALYDHWNTLPLERAHIIPLSRGGSNRLRNFVLLCPDCHEEAPDVVNSLIMLKWLQNRKAILVNNRMRDWIEACLHLDVDPFDAQNKEAEILIRHRSEFEEFQINYSTNHFNTYSIASYVACIVAFAKQKGITGRFDFDLTQE